MLVEVKGLKGKDDEWLAEYRRNLAQTILVAPTAYFMIVMADYMYLWLRGDSQGMDFPDFKAPTVPMLTTEHLSDCNWTNTGRCDLFRQFAHLL